MGSGIFVYILCIDYVPIHTTGYQTPSRISQAREVAFGGVRNVLDASAKDINDLAQKNRENFL